MNELQIFNNPEFGEIRVVSVDGKPYAVGADVARALGYAKPENAIAQHCRCTLKQGVPHPQSPSKMMSVNVIPEGDVYRLIVGSKLPNAVKFERWIFDEVLPSIRAHGMYATPQTVEAMIQNPDTMIRVLTALRDQRTHNTQLTAQIEKDRPKVLFADAVDASDGTCLVGELAKILKGNGVDIGQNRLFERLRDEGYLIRRGGADYNMPTQYSMERGLFKIKETAITHSDGHVTISRTPKVTGKGQQFFVGKLLSR